jgi:23S rRNA pseudouridine1911/1915/1917 synthase
MPSFVVAPPEVGQRLDVFIAARGGFSRNVAQRIAEAGEVLVNGAAAGKKHLLRLGELVEFATPPAVTSSLAQEDVPFTVVYEDDWLIVVDKPGGVVVHPAPGHEHGTLVHGLIGHGIGGGHERRPGIVHRLDKDTSGLLIVARNDEAYRRLTEAMSRREIKREYVALLCGDLPQQSGTVDVAIGRHIRDRKRMSVHTATPRPAVTHFDIHRRYSGFTLTDIHLETGRTHQIRVHFAALGYPVAGDVVYGAHSRPEGLSRQFLHAAALAFRHPGDGRELGFATPLPADLQGFLDGLEPGDD